MRKIIITLVSVAILGLAALAAYEFRNVYSPCSKPILYDIGSFDTRFGVSKDYFLKALHDAGVLWEKPIGRELFAYEPEGSLKINLIYDYRQQASDKLKKLGLAVNKDKASYDALNAKYNTLEATFTSDKASFEAQVSNFKARQSAYEKEVAGYNAGHGAPKEAYDRLNADRIALNDEATRLNQLQDHLNEELDTINALVVVLNHLGVVLNLGVSKYNTTGKTLGGEFEEGNYQSGPDGQHIDIYEFDDRIQLVKLLAHELGHALGLDHVEDPKAIMYRLNDGINGKLTDADLTDLKKQCGIK